MFALAGQRGQMFALAGSVTRRLIGPGPANSSQNQFTNTITPCYTTRQRPKQLSILDFRFWILDSPFAIHHSPFAIHHSSFLIHHSPSPLTQFEVKPAPNFLLDSGIELSTFASIF
jgi:hypothetical protein